MPDYTPGPWLWPDRTIGKKESRILREYHNTLVNSHAELVEALRYVVEADNEARAVGGPECGEAKADPPGPVAVARALLAKIDGGDDA